MATTAAAATGTPPLATTIPSLEVSSHPKRMVLHEHSNTGNGLHPANGGDGVVSNDDEIQFRALVGGWKRVAEENRKELLHRIVSNGPIHEQLTTAIACLRDGLAILNGEMQKYEKRLSELRKIETDAVRLVKLQEINDKINANNNRIMKLALLTVEERKKREALEIIYKTLLADQEELDLKIAQEEHELKIIPEKLEVLKETITEIVKQITSLEKFMPNRVKHEKPSDLELRSFIVSLFERIVRPSDFHDWRVPLRSYFDENQNLVFKLIKHHQHHLIRPLIEAGANILYRVPKDGDEVARSETALSLALSIFSMDSLKALLNSFPALEVGTIITRGLLNSSEVFRDYGSSPGLRNSSKNNYADTLKTNEFLELLIEFLGAKLLEAIEHLKSLGLSINLNEEIKPYLVRYGFNFIQDSTTLKTRVTLTKLAPNHMTTPTVTTTATTNVVTTNVLATEVARASKVDDETRKKELAFLDTDRVVQAIRAVTVVFDRFKLLAKDHQSKRGILLAEKAKSDPKEEKSDKEKEMMENKKLTENRKLITDLKVGQKISYKNKNVVVESDVPDNVEMIIENGTLRIKGNITGKNVQIGQRNSKKEVRGIFDDLREIPAAIVVSGNIVYPETTNIIADGKVFVDGKQMLVSPEGKEIDLKWEIEEIYKMLEGKNLYNNVFRMRQFLERADFLSDTNALSSILMKAVEHGKSGYFRVIKEMAPVFLRHYRYHASHNNCLSNSKMTAHLSALRDGRIDLFKQLIDLEHIMNVGQVLEQDLFEGSTNDYFFDWLQNGGCELEFVIYIVTKLKEAIDFAKSQGVDWVQLVDEMDGKTVKIAERMNTLLCGFGLSFEICALGQPLSLETIASIRSIGFMDDKRMGRHENLRSIFREIIDQFSYLNEELDRLDIKAALKEYKETVVSTTVTTTATTVATTALPVTTAVTTAALPRETTVIDTIPRITRTKGDFNCDSEESNSNVDDNDFDEGASNLFLLNKKDEDIVIRCDIPDRTGIWVENGNLTIESKNIGNYLVINAINSKVTIQTDIPETTKVFSNFVDDTLDAEYVTVKGEKMLVATYDYDDADEFTIDALLFDNTATYPNISLFRRALENLQFRGENPVNVNDLHIVKDTGTAEDRLKTDCDKTDNIDPILFAAASLEREGYIKVLVECGANLNFCSQGTNRTALTDALQYRKLGSIRTLLRLGIAVNPYDADNKANNNACHFKAEYYAIDAGCRTEFNKALLANLFEVVEMALSEASADLNLVDFEQDFLQYLHAKKMNGEGLVKYLMSRKINLEEAFFRYIVLRDVILSPEGESSSGSVVSDEVREPYAGSNFNKGAHYFWHSRMDSPFWENQFFQCFENNKNAILMRKNIREYINAKKARKDEKTEDKLAAQMTASLITPNFDSELSKLSKVPRVVHDEHSQRSLQASEPGITGTTPESLSTQVMLQRPS